MNDEANRGIGQEVATARCIGGGAALVILVAAVSLGTQPALSGDAVQDVQPSAIAGRVRPLDLITSSVSQVLAAVQSQTAAGKCARHRAEIRREADGAGGAENFSDARRQMIDATPAP
jgi:hypothetical protein